MTYVERVEKWLTERRKERCGNCQKWMKDYCPKEKHCNKTGRKYGPNMDGFVCSEYLPKGGAGCV